MAWVIKLSETAEKQLAQLDKPVASRLTKFLRERVVVLDDPRSIGEALTGSRFGELWKYRQGDYRIIASIEDGFLQILVVRIGHRRKFTAAKKPPQFSALPGKRSAPVKGSDRYAMDHLTCRSLRQTGEVDFENDIFQMAE